MDWEQRCKQLQQRVEELERENSILRSKLGYAASSTKTEVATINAPSSDADVHMTSAPEDKIRLFRSLFRGREDVFARRWYSVRKEKGGYSPACANEWKYGVCIKPKGKCSKCENRALMPPNDAVIYRHLCGKDKNGEDVIGVYRDLPLSRKR